MSLDDTSPIGLEAVDADDTPTVVVDKGTAQQTLLGDAFFERVATLEAQIGRVESLEERKQLRLQAVETLDSALRAFQEPMGLARAHFAKAVILADVAREEERERERLETVGQIVDHCQSALSILHQIDQISYQTLTGAHATAAGLLLCARELVKDERMRQALDRLIWAHGEEFGTSLAWDIRQQKEGNDLLFMTRVLSALEELEEDPAIRQELARSQGASAATAARVLSRTSSPGEAVQAADLSRQARERVAALKQSASQPPTCHTCGTLNAAGHSFCVRCGMPLAPPWRSQGSSCPSCGSMNRPGNQNCTRCGFLLS